MSNTRIGIALLGFGTVGSGLYKLLRDQGDEIRGKYGVDFEVRKILVRNPEKKRSVKIPKSHLASSIQDILLDSSVDVVVEVIGGEFPAKGYIQDSLKSGKDVILANKGVMSADGEKLVACARQHGRYLGFSAAVTGCHQFCSSIANSVMVKSLTGIFNSTSNFILAEMEKGLSFDEALKMAQDKGYAEADPTEDVDGLDTQKKLIILTRLAFGVLLDREKVPASGIRNISGLDMEYARQLGYTIKLLGVSRPTPEGRIDARVHPCFVPLKHPLASVKGIANGLQIYDSMRGAQTFIAAGAGAEATSMAILKDLVALAEKRPIIWTSPSRGDVSLKSAKPYSTVRKFYVRIEADNQPGVLANISKIFARHEINITSVIQRDSSSLKTVPVVIMCGPIEEGKVRRALREIEASQKSSSPSQFIRVEDDLHELGAEE